MKIAWGFYQICVLIPAVYRIPEDPQTPDHQVVAGYTLTCYSHTFGPHIGTEVEMPPDVADALNFFSLTVRAARGHAERVSVDDETGRLESRAFRACPFDVKTIGTHQHRPL